jgi:anti-anti-sigma factor
MRLQDFFQVARDMAAAQKMAAHPAGGAIGQQPGYYSWRPSLFWRGEVTAANADEVWQFTQDHLEKIHEGKQVLIDLTDLQFIDSTGLGVMIRAKKKALQKGLKVTFTGPQPNVRNVLKLANLEKFLLEKAT